MSKLDVTHPSLIATACAADSAWHSASLTANADGVTASTAA
jgi:hypothetical protein